MAVNNTLNFQAYLVATFKAIKEEPVIFILSGLLVSLLTIVSMGLLAGPLFGGYFLLFIGYLRDRRKPVFTDIFAGFQQFSTLLPYFLVLLLIFLGSLLLVLPGLLFATWWLYVLPLMVDRKMPFNEAMRLSMNRVNETGFLMHFVFLLFLTVIPFILINLLSAMMPFLMVLKFLLPPFQAGCITGLYLDQFPSVTAATPHQAKETEVASWEDSPSEQEEITSDITVTKEINIPETDNGGSPANEQDANETGDSEVGK
jgi:hypothetical protein